MVVHRSQRSPRIPQEAYHAGDARHLSLRRAEPPTGTAQVPVSTGEPGRAFTHGPVQLSRPNSPDAPRITTTTPAAAFDPVAAGYPGTWEVLRRAAATRRAVEVVWAGGPRNPPPAPGRRHPLSRTA